MDWKDVGIWLQENAGAGAALVGSLLTGKIPSAIAAGVSLVTGATGMGTPEKVLSQFQSDPATVVRLRELAMQDKQNIREHIRNMTELEMKDRQAEHEQAQLTIRSGDNSQDPFVRRTRPGQSWVSLFAALAYVFLVKPVDVYVLGLLLALPWAYAGLRQIGKGVDAVTSMRAK